MIIELIRACCRLLDSIGTMAEDRAGPGRLDDEPDEADEPDEPDELDESPDETTPDDRRRGLVIALFVGVSLVVAIVLAIVYSMPSAG